MAKTAIYIIESPDDDDVKIGWEEGPTIRDALRHARLRADLQAVEGRSAFVVALMKVAEQHEYRAEAAPVLHLSMHGSPEGVRFRSNERLPWDLLGNYLAVVNAALDGRLQVVLSTCSGFSGIQMAWREADLALPFSRLVGPVEGIPWRDTVAAFVAFYHFAYVRGGDVTEAVEIMNHVLNRKANPLFKETTGQYEQAQFVAEARKVNAREELLRNIEALIRTTQNERIRARMEALQRAFRA